MKKRKPLLTAAQLEAELLRRAALNNDNETDNDVNEIDDAELPRGLNLYEDEEQP